MPRIPIHPGEHLAEELATLNMSAAELARHLQVPTNRVTEILNGQRAITGDTALRLGHFFGTSPEFWLNLQSLYGPGFQKRRRRRSHTRNASATSPRMPLTAKARETPAACETEPTKKALRGKMPPETS